ncbi:MAG: cell wall-binding repeat-containing protein [Peptostreptococcus sp.]|uniref:cell wall-binding repeat-containing protein n=1 Tax=Peptostreptococcus sp. TaxID=1262 RepID=UPI002FCB2E97
MSSFKKVVSIVMAGAIVSGGVGQNSVSAEDSKIDVERISGENRVETSIEIAKKLNRKKAYFVSGDNPWDALSVGPVASKERASIILTSAKDRVRSDIKLLDIESATIVGGKNSVSDEISNIIEKTINSSRVAGKDRYESSELLAQKMNSKDIGVATGNLFADALSSGAFLSQKNMPLLLLNNKNEIKDGFNPIYTFGGEKSISKTFGKRIAGDNRYETAEKIAAEYKNFDTIILASGKNFADALSATPLSHQLNAPILLSDGDSLTKGTKEIIKKAKKVVVVGGKSSISQKLVEEIKNINKTNSSVDSSTGGSSSSGSSSSSSSENDELEKDNRIYAKLAIDFDKDGLVEEEVAIALKEGDKLETLVKEMESSTSFLENISPKGYNLKGWKIRGKEEIKSLEEIKELKASKDLLSIEDGEERSIYIEAVFEKDSKDAENPIENEDKEKNPEDGKDKDGKEGQGKVVDDNTNEELDKEEKDDSGETESEKTSPILKEEMMSMNSITINSMDKNTLEWYKKLYTGNSDEVKVTSNQREINKADKNTSEGYYVQDPGSYNFGIRVNGLKIGDKVKLSVKGWPSVNLYVTSSFNDSLYALKIDKSIDSGNTEDSNKEKNDDENKNKNDDENKNKNDDKESKDTDKEGIDINKEGTDKTSDKDKDSTGKDDSGKSTDKEDKEEGEILLNTQVEIKNPPFLSSSLSINTSNKSTVEWFKLLHEQKANFKLNEKDINISKTENLYSKEKSYYIRNVNDGSFSFNGFEDGDIITISIVDKANKQKWPDVNIKYSIGGFGATLKVVK